MDEKHSLYEDDIKLVYVRASKEDKLAETNELFHELSARPLELWGASRVKYYNGKGVEDSLGVRLIENV